MDERAGGGEGVVLIVRERVDTFVLIGQHDHASVSGQSAAMWNKSVWVGADRFDETVLAVFEHDRGWIGPDGDPLWNDAADRPYSFMDYPLLPKLASYRRGLDEIEAKSPYAGLLCSMHYASFFEGAADPHGRRFLREERAQQRRLANACGIAGPEAADALHFHFQLLQFCDDISLYLCLNEPGVGKAEEHPWYRDGIHGYERLHPSGRFAARWEDAWRVRLTPFPFAGEFEAILRYREVGKAAIREKGMAQAYRDAPERELRVAILPERD